MAPIAAFPRQRTPRLPAQLRGVAVHCGFVHPFAAACAGAYNAHQNSYHMRAIDNDKQSVAARTMGFIRGPAGPEAERPEESGGGPGPEHLSVAKIP